MDLSVSEHKMVYNTRVVRTSEAYGPTGNNSRAKGRWTEGISSTGRHRTGGEARIRHLCWIQALFPRQCRVPLDCFGLL